jgi:hypothetical protein
MNCPLLFVTPVTTAVHCSLPKEIGIAQKGGSTFGYKFTPGAGSPFFHHGTRSRHLGPCDLRAHPVQLQ